MKVIFLDVDGVLNCSESQSKCGDYTGIDDKRVKLLRNLVRTSHAAIVLVSSWKDDWERVDKESQNEYGDYLDRKLKREGLYVLDKTDDDPRGDYYRGRSILTWLEKHPNVESWVVLDDEMFDYEECGVVSRLVLTDNENGGLCEEHVQRALELL